MLLVAHLAPAMFQPLVDDIMGFAVDTSNATTISSLSRRYEKFPLLLGLRRRWGFRSWGTRAVISDVKVPWVGGVRLWFSGPNPGFILEFTNDPDGVLSRSDMRVLRLCFVDPEDDIHVKKLGLTLNYEPVSPHIVHRAYPIPDEYLGRFELRMRISIRWNITPDEISVRIVSRRVMHVACPGWFPGRWSDRTDHLIMRTLPNPGCDAWRVESIKY